MVHLSADIVKRLQHCIVEIYSDLNVETFHASMVSAIAKLIPATSIGYAEVNLAKIELSKNVITPFLALSRDQVAAFETHLAEHPLMPLIYPDVAQLRTAKKGGSASPLGDKRAYIGKALKIHDLVTRNQFRRLGLYNEFYRKLGIEYQMLVLLDCGPLLNKNLAVNRDRPDFTGEERLLLNLLVPHIEQAYRNAEAHAEALRAFAAVETSKSFRSICLTSREEDVLYWVAQGKTNAETGRILRIAPGTVKVHLERIYQKLGVENRTAAAALARELPEGRKNGKR